MNSFNNQCLLKLTLIAGSLVALLCLINLQITLTALFAILAFASYLLLRKK
jgi:hypothetical protein